MASTVTLRDARLCISSGFCAGQTKATSTCPSRIRPTSSAPGARTLKMMSASHGSETISAPAARYASSEKFAASPAPDSTATRKPSLTSFSTTSGTVATRFSPAAVSRGMPINWDKVLSGWVREILPWSPHQQALEAFEERVHGEGERRRRQRARQQHGVVVERKALRDALAETAGADESGDRGRADVDHGGGLHARHDGGQGERDLDLAQHLSAAQSERSAGLPQAERHADESGVRVSRNRQQRIKKNREQGGPEADRAGERNQKREERERRNGLYQPGDCEDRLREP